jgi:MFS family permease
MMYFLNYVDRNAIAQARLNDIEEDLGMTGDTQFNTAVSILFVGYVLTQVPSNMLITKVKPGMYMSAWMLVWAVVSACSALVQNFTGLVICRFFLGVTEAPVRRSIASIGVNRTNGRSSTPVLRTCSPSSTRDERSLLASPSSTAPRSSQPACRVSLPLVSLLALTMSMASLAGDGKAHRSIL